MAPSQTQLVHWILVLRFVFRKLADIFLHHGTSYARKESIKKEGLVFDKPKIYRDDKKFDNRIYLVGNFDDAVKYAIKTVLMEGKLTSEEKKRFGIKKHRRIGIVLSVNFKNLDNTKLYRDPEDVHGGGWYIYIDKKIPWSLMRFTEVPLNKVDKCELRLSEADIDTTGAKEKVDPIKYAAVCIEYVDYLEKNEECRPPHYDNQNQFLKRMLNHLQKELDILLPEEKEKYSEFYSTVKSVLENKGHI